MVNIRLIGIVGTIYASLNARVVLGLGISSALIKPCSLNKCGSSITKQITFGR